ncbi:hypothetical protein J4440_04770 [Candidatus Woesearchaeota archaeon]|nr:hypothetical protein [Candidatus Woesearchaeota archaeon]
MLGIKDQYPKMKTELEKGDLVELVLHSGATSVNRGHLEGYSFNQTGFKDEGSRFTGYIFEIDQTKITLSMGIDRENKMIPAVNGNKFMYFDLEAIHSYSLLKMKNKIYTEYDIGD